MEKTHLCPLEELSLGSLHVVFASLPGLQYGGLQGTAVREGQGPWLASRTLVDGVQVDSGVLFRLTAAEECDARHSGWNRPLQGSDCGHGHLVGAVLLGTALASSDHVGLEQGALQEDVVVGQSLVDEGQHLLGHPLSSGQVVVAIGKHLRLHNGHQAVLQGESRRVS